MKTVDNAALCKRVLLLGLPILFLSACAAYKQPQTSIAAPAVIGDAKQIGWYRIGFEITWPEDQSPSWHMDTLLAHRIVAPVLEQYRKDIRLWRFHRRANRDAAGHRFSFIFYAPSATAAQINAAVQAQAPLHKLLSEKRLVRVDYDNPQTNAKPHIEDTSDGNWPLIVQKTWPSFIMGASEMWLGLIRELVPVIRKDEDKDDDKLFRIVQKELSEYWREEGQHPFLHHLNALFSYEEMLVVDKNGKAMRF